ncbi:MAG: monovalent cation/H+ antiporter complex subunit F [Ilumatobacteraceae bacterium]
MSALTWVALSILAVAAVVGVLRVIIRGTLGDRAVAFDMLGAIVSCGVLVAVADNGDGLLLDLAIVLGLLGFLTSVTVARFIESRDKGEQ